MTPKHFEVSLKAGRVEFTYQCTTAYEALCAIEDAVNAGMASASNINFDGYMRSLMNMQHNGLLSSEDKYFRIRYVDGEV